jgi:regulatory protein
MATKPSLPDDERAMQYAFLVLGYRPRSEQEMRQRLERKGYSPAVADQTLAKLTRLGLLNDREFAESWVAARTGYGPARIKQELRQKGIDRDLAEEMISTGISADEEFAAAQRIGTRAVQHATRPLTRDVLLRVRRLLLRRGFSFEVVSRVCARLNAQAAAEEDWLE